MRWFMNIKACDQREIICERFPTTSAELDIAFPVPEIKERESTIVPNAAPKKRLTEEDVASDFIHPATGQYRSLADNIPDHINPETGYYKYGVRKCSACNEFKRTEDFSPDEAAKRADIRVCNHCMGSRICELR